MLNLWTVKRLVYLILEINIQILITEVNSIDNYMIDRKLDNIHFIKCDVKVLN